ncbi:COLEC11 [Branchiostoma lanceolatum]|uniref:COLEC11 protein n=1 Tax=Branchiostoma lanceolatum TaxID=7740 RepID=A0A8J9ZXB3_BRALA|nr:COLEC11 [Branchiostoma lanceolatum]
MGGERRMMQLAVAAIVFTVWCLGQGTSGICQLDWHGHESRCFRVVDVAVAHEDARDHCANHDSSVAVPKDQATNDFLVRLRNSADSGLSVWIGLNDIEEEGTFVWEDGEDLGSFSDWSPGEPNNGPASGPADCVRIKGGTGTNLWGDYPCTTQYGVICEKGSESSGYTNLGCWRDNVGNRAIPTLEGTDPRLDGSYGARQNPLEKCYQVALSRGYAVFAVQNGGWCAGSADGHNTYNNYGPSTACRADGEGGPGANEVYQITGSESSGYTNLGCWTDNVGNRAIPTLEGTDPRLDGSYRARQNPIEKCYQVALSGGFTVFAVQNGGQCFGSADGHNTYNKHGPSTACREDGEGGPGANEVYQITGCSMDYVRFNNVCYKSFTGSNTREEASQMCVEDGGMLAMPKDSATNDFLANLPQVTGGRWLGLTDANGDGQWVFEDGQSLTSSGYSNWLPNEADSGDVCAALYATRSSWDARRCNHRRGFICQRNEGAGLVGFWPLNAEYGTSDVTGNGNDAVATGTQLALGPYGNVNGAFLFSGAADSYLNIPNNGELDVRYSYTILAHIYPTGGAGPIFSYVTNNDGFGVHLVVERGQSILQSIAADVLEQSAWNYVGGSYNSFTGMASLWNNGEVVGQANVGVVEVETQYQVQVAMKDGDSRFFAGRIACLQLYNYAMTEEQIATARDRCKEDDTLTSGEWNGYNYTVHGSRQTHATATDECASFGARLADSKSADVNNFLVSLANGVLPGEAFWFGLHDYEHEGQWQWSDDTDVDYTNWHPGEPNGGVGQSCGQLYTSNSMWDDDSCDIQKYYICQQDTWLSNSAEWVVDASGDTYVDAQGVAYGPDKVLDDDSTTYWNPNGVADEWYIIFHLGLSYTLSTVRVQSTGDFTHDVKAFKFQGSNSADPYVWADALIVDVGNSNEHQEFGTFSATAKYWRLLITETQSGGQPWLAGVQFRGMVADTVHRISFDVSEAQLSGSNDNVRVLIYSTDCGGWCLSTTVPGRFGRGETRVHYFEDEDFGRPEMLQLRTDGDNRLALDQIRLYNGETGREDEFPCNCNLASTSVESLFLDAYANYAEVHAAMEEPLAALTICMDIRIPDTTSGALFSYAIPDSPK